MVHLRQSSQLLLQMELYVKRVKIVMYIENFKFYLKKGKIVIVLSGRYAGKKAVIMKSYDKGTESHNFGHCLGNHY